jgi:serine/threonine protein kinase
VKPGNIVAVGSSGTFKLIDMDSIFHTQTWDEEDDEEEQQQQQQQQDIAQPDSRQGVEMLLQQQQPVQQQPVQQQRQRTSVGVAAGGGMGTPCPASLSAHLAAGAAWQQQQSQPPAAAAAAAAAGPLTALSFAGTPENMAPEASPTVLQLPLVLWDLFPLRAGQQVASSTAVAPAQDIWSSGTVLYELLTGRSVWGLKLHSEMVA